MTVSNTNHSIKFNKYNKTVKKYMGGFTTISILFVLIIAIGAILIFHSNSKVADVKINYMDFYSFKKIGYDSVLIVNGDTVDGLINRYFNNYNLEDNKDIRKEIKNEIMKLNNLDRYGTIYAGGYLLIPIYE